MKNWLTIKNKNVPAGRGNGVDGGKGRSNGVAASGDRSASQQEAADLDGENVVQRRHSDWTEHQNHWKWMLDSYEGGDRYRNAVYGPDRRGLPCRNLFRHKREYPDPQYLPGWDANQGFPGGGPGALGEAGSAQSGIGPFPGQLGSDAGAAIDDDYELRRARTPVPQFVGDAVGIHLAKVYDQEVSRDGPDDLLAWWKDVDGRGTPIDDWMEETVAALLLVLGTIDICLDHPAAPPGQTIETKADEIALGLDKCIASYILPQNMVWWRVDTAGRYTECLVREFADPADRNDTDQFGNPIDADGALEDSVNWRQSYVRWRYWTETESILLNNDGSDVIGRTPHNYGRVPIVRLIDLKKLRTPNIGQSRYVPAAMYQREYYNRDSELILSDTLQAHPFLSGAEDFCKADNTLAVGPGYVLPMKKNVENGTYQGWEFVSPPKDPADSLRKNKADIERLKDRSTCQESPATASVSGSGAGPTQQSGVAKQIDATTGHKLLKAIAKSLAKAERFIAEYALIVIRAPRPITPADREAIKVVYPSRFELFSAAELTDGLTKLQAVVMAAGELPEAEAIGIKSIQRQLFLGLTDKDYARLDKEVDDSMKAKATLKEQMRSIAAAGISDDAAATEGSGSAEQAAGSDPTSQSAATMATNTGANVGA